MSSAGLLGQHGIILGRLGSRCLMLAGQQGVALAAPPRAGKGTGVVVPNALNWPGSLVCVDIKRENWTITAGFRNAHGQACYLFDPFAEDSGTSRWNPLSKASKTSTGGSAAGLKAKSKTSRSRNQAPSSERKENTAKP